MPLEADPYRARNFGHYSNVISNFHADVDTPHLVYAEIEDKKSSEAGGVDSLNNQAEFEAQSQFFKGATFEAMESD